MEETADQRRKTRIQRANEEKIINSAKVVFSQFGFNGATVDQIADMAGLSKPNLHYYFKTKRDLYLATLNRVLDAWMPPLESLDPSGDPETELSRYIDQKLALSRDDPESSKLFALEVIQGAETLELVLETRLQKLTAKKKNVLNEWARQGKIAPINATHFIFMLWAVTQHYADFDAQIKSLTGKTLQNNAFFKSAQASIKQILFHGVLPPNQ